MAKELINAFKRVTGEENILFKVADAAPGHPDDPTRQVISLPSAAAGGRCGIWCTSSGPRARLPHHGADHAARLPHQPLSAHYRRGLIALPDPLEFRSGNTAFHPVIEALELIRRYAKAGDATHHPRGEAVTSVAGGSSLKPEVLAERDGRCTAKYSTVV